MFYKRYYGLEEAAKKLDTDVESLIDCHLFNNCQICVAFSSNGIALNFDLRCRRFRDHVEFISNAPYPVVYGELNRHEVLKSFKNGALINCPNLYHLNEKSEAPDFIELEVSKYSNESFKNLYPINFNFSDDDFDPRFPYGGYWDWAFSTNTQISSDSFVITHKELTRLMKLPSYEQLQTENQVLNQRIAELEVDQSNDTKQPIQQQREQALLFWVEGVGRDMVMTMTKQQIHNALKKIDPIFHFSDFDKFWKKQQIIKLEAGKPTR